MESYRTLIVNLVAIGWLAVIHPTQAQVIDPPEEHWIGPEASCDYPTIQAALDDIFDCTGFCLPKEHELLLSANYQHSGQIVIARSFDIIGGFGGGCGTSLAGPVATLGNAPPGEPLIVVAPGNRSITNNLVKLALTGPGSESPPSQLGGVIAMEAGDATLTLKDSAVRNGVAILGGGIYLAGDGNQLVFDNGFVQTSEAFAGGGIHCTRGGVVDFRSGRIEENIAERSGGGVFLDNGCLLRGTTAGTMMGNVNRSIEGNILTDIQQAQGAGIFARAATIELGALYSLTEIKDNIAPTFVQTGVIGQPGGPPVPVYDHYRYDLPGINRGGGVHMEHSMGTFLNTRFVRNEAADGGAISVAGDSELTVDRTSGPCTTADIGMTQDCSLFFRNRARGGRDGPGEEADEGGDGAVIYGRGLDGIRPKITISRSAWSDNAAGCFEASQSDFEGECDLPTTVLGVTRFSNSSIYFAATDEATIEGNLIVNNSIGDDEDTLFITKEGIDFVTVGPTAFTENTISGNLDADASFGPLLEPAINEDLDLLLLNNIIDDAEVDEAIIPKFEGFYETEISSCNVSIFASELNLQTLSAAIPNVDEDPLFVDPGAGEFALQTPGSPAIDRCDDADGRINSTYDILGNPRPMDVGSTTNGSGLRDAGAFESIPLEGLPQNTTDLAIDIRSDLPKTAPLGTEHQFLIFVTNTGRNAPNALTVRVDADSGGAFTDLQGQTVINPASSQVTNHWDCQVLAGVGECTMTKAALEVGETLLPIVAEVTHLSQGEKFVSATVTLDDPSLIELSPANDTDTDSVTVGDGADLQLDLSPADPEGVPFGRFTEFTVRISNTGPEIATGVQVMLTGIGGNTELDNFDAPGWVCISSAPSEAVCSLNQSLDTLINEGGLPRTFTFGATGPDPGNDGPLAHWVAASVTTDDIGDPNFGNNSDNESFLMLSDALFYDGFENIQ